jgi:hypothetical protein
VSSLFFETFSPNVDFQYTFYRVTFSPKQRESLYLRENLSPFMEILSSAPHFLSVSLYFPLSLYLRCLAVNETNCKVNVMESDSLFHFANEGFDA